MKTEVSTGNWLHLKNSVVNVNAIARLTFTQSDFVRIRYIGGGEEEIISDPGDLAAFKQYFGQQ